MGERMQELNEPPTLPEVNPTGRFVWRNRWLWLSPPGVGLLAWPVSHFLSSERGQVHLWFGVLAWGVLGPALYALFAVPLHFVHGDRVLNPLALASVWFLIGALTDVIVVVALVFHGGPGAMLLN